VIRWTIQVNNVVKEPVLFSLPYMNIDFKAKCKKTDKHDYCLQKNWENIYFLLPLSINYKPMESEEVLLTSKITAFTCFLADIAFIGI